MVVSWSAGRRVLTSWPFWVLLAGSTFGVVATVTALSVLQNPFLRLMSMVPNLAPYLAGCAAFLVGGLCWWLAVERPRVSTRGRGALVGFLTGLLAHPVMWFFVLAYDTWSHYADPSRLLSSLANGDLLGGLLFFTFFSWLSAGLLTVPIGIVVGLAVAAGRRRTVDWTSTGERSAFYWVSNFVVLGVTVVLLPVLMGRAIVPILVAGLAATAITDVALRYLPVVRAFITRVPSNSSLSAKDSPEPPDDPLEKGDASSATPIDSPDDSTCSSDNSTDLPDNSTAPSDDSVARLTDFSFLVRYWAAVLGFGCAYFLASLGYIVAFGLGPFFHPFSPSASEGFESMLLLAYPVFFAGLALVVAFAVERRRNGGEPDTSWKRWILEWSAYLGLLVGTYAIGWLRWLTT